MTTRLAYLASVNALLLAHGITVAERRTIATDKLIDSFRLEGDTPQQTAAFIMQELGAA